MKRIGILLALLLGVSACVQPTQRQTVVFTLDVSAIKQVHSVGIRGTDTPLSWAADLPMQVVEKGKKYRAVVIFQTGFRYTEVKFVVNDTFEFAQQNNRKLYFHPQHDTTFCHAVFNRR